MPNEITAEELARKVYSPLGNDYDGQIPSYWTDAAETFLSLTRAHAALMAEREPKPMVGLFKTLTQEQQKAALSYRGDTDIGTPAGDRVRCWLGVFSDGSTAITKYNETAAAWVGLGHTAIEGYFTAKGSTDD